LKKGLQSKNKNDFSSVNHKILGGFIMSEPGHAGVLTVNRQKILGNKGLLAFIVLMNMFIPLSTDLYLPALPKMNLYFHSSAAVTNMTLSVFFVCYAAGILFWGPVSDKYGRKPVIIIGNAVYLLSCIACAMSVNVYFLILARAFQGIGGGGITSASTAIIKDVYSGKRRETILAVTQSISGLAPVLAPMIGAWILLVTSWRGSFWALLAVSLINALLAFLYEETLTEEEKYRGSLRGVMSRLLIVLKNKSFSVPAVIFSLSSLPFMGFISISSYVYVDYFGLSEQIYSYYFAVCALISTMGPIIYVRFFTGFPKSRFVIWYYSLTGFCGLLFIFLGRLSPSLFFISAVLFFLCYAMIRPFGINLLFEQHDGDTGSASAVINTVFMVAGSIGMTVTALPLGNIVARLGIFTTCIACAAIAAWYLFLKSAVPCKGVKD
jgi:DHA1 family bicyclomycin/chloramphenicol resistance-like MFS transporter